MSNLLISGPVRATAVLELELLHTNEVSHSETSAVQNCDEFRFRQVQRRREVEEPGAKAKSLRLGGDIAIAASCTTEELAIASARACSKQFLGLHNRREFGFPVSTNDSRTPLELPGLDRASGERQVLEGTSKERDDGQTSLGKDLDFVRSILSRSTFSPCRNSVRP